MTLPVLLTGSFIVVLDFFIVSVALPAIATDLGAGDSALEWVVAGYGLTFAVFLIVAGRLGDELGRRRVFVAGLGLFTVASALCGLASSPELLVVARAVQGLGGAVVAATALSSVLTLFTEPGERAKAMGIFAFVASGGGTIGVLAGGVLTDALDWRWVFLVNLPIGLAAIALCPVLLPPGPRRRGQRVDVAGAVLVTGAVMLAVFGVVRAGEDGWGSTVTLLSVAGAAAGLAAFVAVERAVAAPLVPFAAQRRRSLAAANVIAPLLAGGLFTLFFFAPQLMQRSLEFDPMQVGLGFLPATLLLMALSLGLSARLVMRFGTKPPLVAGVCSVVAALVLFALAPADAGYARAVLPSMLLLGLGGGLAFSPLILTATADAAPEHAGLTAGLINTTQMLGGALGLAVTAAIAASGSDGRADGRAFVDGLQSGALAGVAFAAVAALVAVVALRSTAPPPGPAAATPAAQRAPA